MIDVLFFLLPAIATAAVALRTPAKPLVCRN